MAKIIIHNNDICSSHHSFRKCFPCIFPPLTIHLEYCCVFGIIVVFSSPSTHKFLLLHLFESTGSVIYNVIVDSRQPYGKIMLPCCWEFHPSQMPSATVHQSIFRGVVLLASLLFPISSFICGHRVGIAILDLSHKRPVVIYPNTEDR